MYEHFFHLASRIAREVTRGLSRSPEVKNITRDLRNMAKDVQREFSSYQGEKPGGTYQQGGGGFGPNADPYGPNGPQRSPVSSVTPKYKTVSVAGILFTVFGGIGLAIFLFYLLMSAGLALVMDLLNLPFLLLSAVLLVLAAASVWMLVKGISLLKRTSRLKRYLKIVGNSQFCPIDLLARGIGMEKDFVVKDLQKMIQKRVLPEAHIDDQKSCLMLSDEIYEQYLYVQNQAKARQEAEEKKRREEEQARAKEQQQEQQVFDQNPELAAAVRQGREMIQRIREVNDRIEGQEVSAKMDRLEQVAERIFEQVQEHPEKLPDIRKLMSYYLPTTLKLLDAYEEFDSQPVQGENIKNAKQQIEKTLDTINLAFENLLDQLFTDEVLDVSSDISVLETMLKQEGLTGSEFHVQ